MKYTRSNKPLFLFLGVLWLSLIAWSIFHAVGSYRFNHHLGRPLMVVGCMTAFLAFWGAMLAARSARLRRSKED